MTTQELQARAAELAFAMLRFTQPAAHPFPGASEDFRAGVDWYVFSPSWRKTPRDEVVPFLTSLSSPSMMLPTIYRGRVALLVLDEAEGERKSWFQKTLDNQLAAVDAASAQLQLQPDSRVLLEFADEEHIFPFVILRAWAQRYIAGAGWNLLQFSDKRADARLVLYGPEGLQGWGRSSPIMPAA